ncbi:MAG: hypothetical protein OIF48_01830 [Silicimonas sp.]|nr:hypothetical protein [Silicimonas sp.]
MRLPDPARLAPLVKLTQAREKAALAELGQAAAKRDAAAARVAELMVAPPAPQDADEAAALDRWLIWRAQELQRRQGLLAKARAEYDIVRQRSGRVIAEHGVVETLADQAKDHARKTREAKRLEALGLMSNLLADDIGNQDI